MTLDEKGLEAGSLACRDAYEAGDDLHDVAIKTITAYLAATAQQPDVEVVERVARLIHDYTRRHGETTLWDEPRVLSDQVVLTERQREAYRFIARAAITAIGGKVEGEEQAWAHLGRFAARYSHPERRQPHANVTAEELLSAIWHHPGNLARKSPAPPAQEQKP